MSSTALKRTKKGPPTKCTDAFIERVIECIEKGLPKGKAFTLGGVNEQTGFDWLAEVRKDREKAHPQWVKLYDALEGALARHEDELVDVIRSTATSGMPNTWQAAAWLLERRNPNDWARRDKVEVEAGDKPLIQLNQVVLGDTDTRQLGRDLLRRVASPPAHLTERAGASSEPSED